MATPQEMGITFEPIESLFGGAKPPGGMAQNAPAAAPTASPAAPVPAVKADDFDLALIGDCVQNERNAALFYEHLAAISNTAVKRSSLAGVADSCRKNSRAFNTLYKKHKGQDYEIRDTQVDTSVNLRDGLKWAIREEGLALREISLFLEKDGGEYNKELLATLARKIGSLGVLVGLLE